MQWLNKRDEHGLKPMDYILDNALAGLSDAIVRAEMHDERGLICGANPLHHAAAQGLIEVAERMLNDGFRPNSRDDLGETALHTAVRHNRLFMVQLLLKHCRPNLPNNNGLTPLHWAVLVDNQDILRALLEQGADPSASNIQLDGMSPLKLASLLHRGDAYECMLKYARTVAA